MYAPTSKKATPNVNAGSWNLTESKFLGPNKPLEHWAVINFASFMIRLPQLQDFTTTLIAQCRARGKSISFLQFVRGTDLYFSRYDYPKRATYHPRRKRKRSFGFFEERSSRCYGCK